MTEQLFITCIDNIIYIRCMGHLTALLSSSAKNCFKQLIDSSIVSVYIDFKQAQYLDSTFIGLLVIFNKLSLKFCGGNIKYTNLGGECKTLLDDCGVLPLLDEAKEPFEWPDNENEIFLNQEDDPDLLLESHTELSGLSPENAARFRLLREILQKQMHPHQ